MAYTIQSGDTLSGIAARNNTTVSQLMALNPYITDPNKIYAGKTLNLAAPAPTTTTTTTTVKAPDDPSNKYNTSTGALNPKYTGNTTMTPSSLTPTAPFPTVQPKTTSPYPVSTLQTPQLTQTSQEKEASRTTSQLRSLYDSLVGKSAYQEQQNQAFGVNAAQQTISDLSAQLTGIKNEAAAIPLQLQQGAADRGVTIPQLGAQQNSRLRTNAIQALSVSTLLAASQGQLANAQALADRAVAQKYDPILEKIEALKANLGLILNDPLTSLQDRNRAQAQLDLQNQREQEAQMAKQNETAVWQIATSAAANQQNFKPTGQYTNVATTLQAISTAPTREQALNIAVSTGLLSGAVAGVNPDAKILGNATTGYFTYDPLTGQTSPIKNPSPTTSGGGSSSDGTITTFTPTQFNSGASKAGVSLAEFKTLPIDVQNYFVNKSATDIKAITTLFEQVKAGTKTSAEVKALIDSAPIPQSVKDYWNAKLAAITPAQQSGSGSILGGIWDSITNWWQGK